MKTPRQVEVSNINTVGCFGRCEVEVAAGRLVRFLRLRDTWYGLFTFEELREFYKQNNWDPNEMLYGLMGLWEDDSSGRFEANYVCHYGSMLQVTPDFVRKVGAS